MKTNNRPMVKEIRYIWITKDGEEISLAFAQDGNGNGDWSVYGYKPTGKTKEIERPMYDTEYIEYLEKENKELKEWKIKSLEESIERINAYKFNLMYQKDELIKIVNSVLENNSKEIEYGQISNAQIIEKIEKAMKEIEYE